MQTYLDRIIPNEDDRIVIRNIYQIRDLDLNEVNNRKVHGRAENNLVPYLAKFVEHYEEWACLIKQQSLVLYDEKEIQEFKDEMRKSGIDDIVSEVQRQINEWAKENGE